LGRIGDKSAVAPLLSAASKPNGKALEHAIIYALIEIQDAEATAKGMVTIREVDRPLIARVTLDLRCERPVAELTLEQDAGRTTSGLIGAIWQVRHNLSLDAGWRIARAERASLREFRAGFTWAVPLWSDSQPRGAVPSSPQLRRNLRA
jgi:hypothetical protein